MPYRMTTPCPECPFRNDIPAYLRAERVREIARSLERAEFPCHKTTTTNDEGEHVRTDNETHCAGALILLEKIDRPSQMMRIARQLKIYDPAKLDMSAPVFGSFREMEAAQSDYEEPEREERTVCHVVNYGCEAPAGYMVGGLVEDGEGSAEHVCGWCHEPVCGACSTVQPDGSGSGARMCDDCKEDHEDAADVY